MPYVSEEQYKTIRNLRDTIDGELNRIAVTDDENEIDQLIGYLTENIKTYTKHNRDRIKGVYEPEPIINPIRLDF